MAGMLAAGCTRGFEFFEQVHQNKKARRLGGLKVQGKLEINLDGLTVVGRFAV